MIGIFKVGDLVRIKSKYRGVDERDILYRVVDVNMATNRCYIEPEFSELSIPPQELVDFEMIHAVIRDDRDR